MFPQIPPCTKAPTRRSVLLGTAAATLVLLAGCASGPPVGVTRDELKPLPGAPRVQLGMIAVVPASQPATVSFQQPEGQPKTFGEGASAMAAKMLDPSVVSPDPGVCAVVGVAGAVVAPVAAVMSGNSGARARLAADQLSTCESNLLSAMRTMAAQAHFRDKLVTAAHEKTGRRLVPLEPTRSPAIDCPSAETVVETQVQQLRLERTGKSDTSYALRIQARVRALRAVDGAVLYEHPVEYRTGTCLFVDWTLSDAFQQVADYAYGEMAGHVVDQLLVATPEGPVLAGAGYKKSPARQPEGATELARRGGGSVGMVQRVSYPVSSPSADPGTIRVYPRPAGTPVGVQAPMTKEEAEVEVARNLEWSFDGLYNHPNPVVYAPAIAVAIPVSLWNQLVAGVRGLTERQAREAEAQLKQAVLEAHPHEQLAGLVAQQLAPQTSQLVILEKKPLPLDEAAEYAVLRNDARFTRVGLHKGLGAVDYLGGPGTDVALEIRVIDARLAAKSGVNPPLALCLEAEARLLRASDGEPLYSCPISYRSEARPFTKWAAHDAQLFRQELRDCYREVSARLVQQLVARGLVAPSRTPSPTVASQ